ncbi:hypothetical protein [Novosphingobium rosa]|uniref:hypothetical protein n=1 Tax=Novosphingobium rosa TaxID=76978 RepID=UPI0008330C54|nr:hypothetical protein [Novosphingobium rosa]
MFQIPKIPVRVMAEYLGLLLALMALGIQQLRITGVKLEPKLGPVHFVLIDMPGWRQRALDAEKERDALKTAGQQARAAQIAQNRKPAVISRQIAEKIDAQAPAYAARVDAAVAAYARAHPVPVCLRVSAAQGGVASGPGAGGAAGVAQGGSGQDVSPGMVAISVASLHGFADNTRDLDILRAYFAWLIAKGLGVVGTSQADDPAPPAPNSHPSPEKE